MARGGGSGLFAGLIAAGAGILGLCLIMMLAPVIGGQFESAMPALGATSDWNETHNTALTTGAEAYQMLSPFLPIVALVGLAMMIIGIVAGRW